MEEELQHKYDLNNLSKLDTGNQNKNFNRMDVLENKEKKHSLGVNLSFNLILSLSTILFPIIIFPYVSRVLGPEGVGKVQFVISFTQYFILIAALGTPVYGIREVSKISHDPVGLKKIFTILLSLNIITSVVLCILFIIIILCVPTLRVDLKFYLISGINILLSFSSIDWFFSGIQKFKVIALRSLIVKVIFLLILFLLVRDRADILPYLFVVVGASLLNNVYNIFSARKYFDLSLINKSDFNVHLKPLLFIFSSIVIASVYSALDTVLLGFIKGYTDVGYYSAASRLVKAGIPILTALSSVLLPQLTQSFRNKESERINELINKGFSYVVLLGIPITVGLIALSSEIIVFFSGNEFFEASLTLKIMAPVALIIGISTVWLVLILSPNSKDKEGVISASAGLIMSLVLNSILIPKYGHVGAAISNLFSEFAVMCFFIYFASKVIKYKFDWKFFFQCLFVSLMFFPIIYCVKLSALTGVMVLLVCILACAFFYITTALFFVKNKLIADSILTIKQKINA